MKNVKKWISFMLIAVLLLGAFGIDGSLLNVTVTEASNRLGLEESVGLGLKDTYVFHLNTKKKIKWSSSNTKIATVTSKGKVTAKSYGDTVITANVSGKKYKCKLSVCEPCFCDSKYQWVESNRTMKVGETYRLRLAWATPKSYSSNLASIASVNKKGIVTAKKSGVATITVKDTLNRKIDMKIVVQKKGTKKIAPTAVQKKRMHNSQYVSYDKLVKNNHYDKTIITDNIVKKTKLKSIDNKKLPMLSGVIMENRGQINNYRADIDVNDVYSGGLTSDYVTEEEINFQAVNGMNCIRLMYSLSYLSKGSNVDQINVTELQVLDEIVSWCMKNNVSLMLSYSEVPGHDVKHAKNIFYDNSWLSDPQTSEMVKRYMALIAQRYADLPNSAIMYELEAEPAIVFHAYGTPDMDKYCAVNNSYADAIWKYQKDAVCLVEDVGMNYFPEACAKHGINIASHSDGRPENIGDYAIVGIDTEKGEVYDPVLPVYLPSIISTETGKMTFVSKEGFDKQNIYVGAQEGVINPYGDHEILIDICADGKKLGIQETTDTYARAVIPKGTKTITIEPGVYDNVRVDAVRLGNLVIPAINHYQNKELKQPVITIHKDGSYEDNMYDDPADWYYDVWLKEPYELCQKYGVSFVRTEVSTCMDPTSGFSNYENAYDLGKNPKNFKLAIDILEFKLKACKKFHIGWMAWCTNDTFSPATQLAYGSIAVKYLKPRTTDSGMTQWKNTGFWYIKPITDMMKKYR